MEFGGQGARTSVAGLTPHAGRGLVRDDEQKAGETPCAAGRRAKAPAGILVGTELGSLVAGPCCGARRVPQSLLLTTLPLPGYCLGNDARPAGKQWEQTHATDSETRRKCRMPLLGDWLDSAVLLLANKHSSYPLPLYQLSFSASVTAASLRKWLDLVIGCTPTTCPISSHPSPCSISQLSTNVSGK